MGFASTIQDLRAKCADAWDASLSFFIGDEHLLYSMPLCKAVLLNGARNILDARVLRSYPSPVRHGWELESLHLQVMAVLVLSLAGLTWPTCTVVVLAVSPN